MTRILFFIETLHGGGAEKVLRTLVNNMDKSRFDITVMTLWPENAAEDLSPEVHYRSLYRHRDRFSVLQYRLEAALGLCYRLHIHDEYDVEVAYLECASTKIMAASTNHNAKKLAWVHCDLCVKFPDPKNFVRKSKRWYQKYDKVVCVSKQVKDSFEALFGSVTPSVVAYNTVNDGDIREKSVFPTDIQKRRTTVVSAGRLCEQKSFDRLLRVHTRLLLDGVDHDLWILGEGAERTKLEKYIAEHMLSDSVRLLGFQENPYPYFRAADLLVCSSVYEGFSTFITEGLILGKPIVTTACSGMDELLGDSQYGLIVENNEESLYYGMKQMLEDQQMRQGYSDMAKIRGNCFKTENLVSETEKILLEMIL